MSTHREEETEMQPELTTVSRAMITPGAPPAYTRYSSTMSVYQNIDANQEPPTFLKSERQALQILGISATILGSVSVFMSVLTVVFNTVMFCTGTGFWGGCTSVINGILILLRYRQHNTKVQMYVLTIFGVITICSSVASVILALLGTSLTSTTCCYRNPYAMPTSPSLVCNIGASQMANSSIASLAFVEMAIGIITVVILSKYVLNCYNHEDFYPPM